MKQTTEILLFSTVMLLIIATAVSIITLYYINQNPKTDVDTAFATGVKVYEKLDENMNITAYVKEAGKSVFNSIKSQFVSTEDPTTTNTQTMESSTN